MDVGGSDGVGSGGCNCGGHLDGVDGVGGCVVLLILLNYKARYYSVMM